MNNDLDDAQDPDWDSPLHLKLTPELIVHAVTFGTSRTISMHPATITHEHMTADERAAVGIDDISTDEANIHAGEVEGKEALQVAVRELIGEQLAALDEPGDHRWRSAGAPP